MELDTTKLAIICVTVVAAATIVVGGITTLDASVLVGMVEACIAVIAGLAGYNVGFKHAIAGRKP